MAKKFAKEHSAPNKDPRRSIPRVDELLEIYHATPSKINRERALEIAREVQADARAETPGRFSELSADDLAARVREEYAQRLGNTQPSSLTAVLNATGVIIHTNLGRAPLSNAAQEALIQASGYVDVEMDLDSGRRSSTRGKAPSQALVWALGTPAAEDALIVGNGAGALMLAATALCGIGGQIIISRGELIEIGAGFRLPELIEATGAKLIEVGATNRTHLADYAKALEQHGTTTGSATTRTAIFKVHPSNYRVAGFHAEVGLKELRTLADEYAIPLITDVGSGLLHPEPRLPQEPDMASALKDGADLVIASGDKLFGGPQAGLIAGKKSYVQALRQHPLARAVRVDKLTLAAIEATIYGHDTAPVLQALRSDPEELRRRTEKLAADVGVGEVIEHEGRVGGGGAPEYPLPGWALALPAGLSALLRQPTDPDTAVVVAREYQGHTLIDLRCVPEEEDAAVADALKTILDKL
ncbi:L-seryl-tRNA(Sec) selenium transferase [Corynebacterium spheniscorum]|uniref:L-seryl-tRNA(Sec) selenium transferase n=1 Tax=Corynebacterium spheniscorum TaxID=185761 RepID=A0A1I2PR11_9CORY|nr:L-seryl-tRNA(Sec) selenium transferase [Corynebacterium spheniscorum]KAA8723787.1 L-seryl-tRNA(Sec) selenium transferase [Corynebacterium spheniscorum]SFG16457.1 L-seryl-tRNA(Sec) selenium transferase [Corynebacterium spheniscorum]